MKVNRRRFLRSTTLVLGAVGGANAENDDAHQTPEDLLDLNSLPHFVDRLPIPHKASPFGFTASRENSGRKISRYRITTRQFQAKVHRDISPTTLWGYGGSFPGPTIEVR